MMPPSSSAPWRCGVLLLLALAAGCASTAPHERAGFTRPPGTARVLLMPPDVELGEVTAAGLYKARADWTRSAREHLLAALGSELAARGTQLVPYRSAAQDSGLLEPRHVQTVKLHEALENTLLRYVYVPGGGGVPRSLYQLPTKRDALDWTLGEAVAPLRADYGADYALFVHLRDRTPSAGRVAVNVAVFLAFLAIESSDEQFGFATLLDLKTGDLLWANLTARQFGDVRTPGGAAGAARALLADLPL